MNAVLGIFVIALSIAVFFGVVYMLVKRNLNESNSILWLFIAFLTLLSGVFPGLINRAAALVGVDYPPTLLFLISTLTLLLISFKNSIEISKNDARLIELTVTLSIVREENRQLALLVAKMREDAEESGEGKYDT